MIWRLVCLVWIFLATSCAVWAQTDDDPINTFLQDQEESLKAPTVLSPDYLDENVQAALRAAFREYYAYHESGYRHRRAVFDWQLMSSQIIFAVVILLVLIGVYFSWLQFMAVAAPEDDKEKPGKPVDEAAGKKPGLATTLEASLQGIKVTSSVLGVVILVISLAFFYLYLVHVHPITELF